MDIHPHNSHKCYIVNEILKVAQLGTLLIKGSVKRYNRGALLFGSCIRVYAD